MNLAQNGFGPMSVFAEEKGLCPREGLHDSRFLPAIVQNAGNQIGPCPERRINQTFPSCHGFMMPVFAQQWARQQPTA